ncbi:MAG: hypothetical protein J7L62_03595 [Candidatus Aminicenantes bacterium]|nr:hypothetical protein [Candidatus Aminicenantes bacterium]
MKPTGKIMLFDIEEKTKFWEKFPHWSIALFFLVIFFASLTLSYVILNHAATLKQALIGGSISLVFSVFSILFYRIEYSNENLVKSFLNSLLLALAFFLISSFLVMLAVIVGPNIAHGLRIEAMKLLLFSFQQIATSFLLLSPAFLSIISLGRMIIRK